ncbi:MAG: hypothetical protein IKO07_06285 [Clostridia bacterium]|nr:hypothetical protein [Clostridia bacterium]
MKDYISHNHNTKRQPRQKHFFFPEFNIEAEIGDSFMMPASDLAGAVTITNSVTIPRYEYNSLVSKVAVYDLLRDYISRNDNISGDTLRHLLGIIKMPQEEKKA